MRTPLIWSFTEHTFNITTVCMSVCASEQECVQVCVCVCMLPVIVLFVHVSVVFLLICVCFTAALSVSADLTLVQGSKVEWPSGSSRC